MGLNSLSFEQKYLREADKQMRKIALTNNRVCLSCLNQRRPKKLKALLLAEITIALATISLATAQTYLPAITDGHADIGAAYEDGALHLELHVHGATPAQDSHQELDESIVRFDFTGENKSSLLSYQVWKSPHAATPGYVFLGFGAEEVAPGVFAGDNLTLEVTGFSFAAWNGSATAGNFFLLQEDQFGTEILLYNSTTTTIGSVPLLAGTHDHGEWAFTEAGIYDVNFKLSGTLAAGGTAPLQVTGTLRFEIVPEPSGGALVMAGMAVVLAVRRMRR